MSSDSTPFGECPVPSSGPEEILLGHGSGDAPLAHVMTRADQPARDRLKHRMEQPRRHLQVRLRHTAAILPRHEMIVRAAEFVVRIPQQVEVVPGGFQVHRHALAHVRHATRWIGMCSCNWPSGGPGY